MFSGQNRIPSVAWERCSGPSGPRRCFQHVAWQMLQILPLGARFSNSCGPLSTPLPLSLICTYKSTLGFGLPIHPPPAGFIKESSDCHHAAGGQGGNYTGCPWEKSPYQKWKAWSCHSWRLPREPLGMGLEGTKMLFQACQSPREAPVRRVGMIMAGGPLTGPQSHCPTGSIRHTHPTQGVWCRGSESLWVWSEVRECWVHTLVPLALSPVLWPKRLLPCAFSNGLWSQTAWVQIPAPCFL